MTINYIIFTYYIYIYMIIYACVCCDPTCVIKVTASKPSQTGILTGNNHAFCKQWLHTKLLCKPCFMWYWWRICRLKLKYTFAVVDGCFSLTGYLRSGTTCSMFKFDHAMVPFSWVSTMAMESPDSFCTSGSFYQQQGTFIYPSMESESP